ncbi:MAG: Acetyltransferase (GNAT) domain protein [Candidatus Argoarchaeum ethanivorans]|uniref:Acetyltransferase (GNAT) domain protein n=1 Tax=Candidatus Argoarchaeum ethanivorans TaxID=2608793 RepID=A0A811T6I3_9EURY|nr:MAG: Acetyltransferase (GNAT) domain protein [Candidatus Argoarchaeum ethanivorans]
MERKWSIRSYEKGDENGIFELMKAVPEYPTLEKEKWMRWWNWKYMDNPAGVSGIWVADHDGKIVGSRSTILVKMKIAGKPVMGSQNTDLITHPNYRRQGIFSALEKKSFDQLKDDGICITYSLPGPMSYPGYMKSGSFFDTHALQTMIRPFNLENALKRRIKNEFLLKICAVTGNIFINIFYRAEKRPEVNGLTITKISSFDDRVNDFWKKISNDYEIIVVRDKEYLNWRYVDIPNVRYTIYLAEEREEICGYVVLECVKEEGLSCGHILDIVAPLDRPEVIHSLLSKAIKYFKQESVDVIFCKMIADKIFYKIFRKNGFISSHFISFLSKRFGIWNKHVVRINSSKISETYLKDSKNWFIQLGDSDFI